MVSPFININETTVNNLIDKFFINKIHNVLLNDSNYQEFELKKPKMSQVDGDSTFNQNQNFLFFEQEQISSENKERFFNFLIDTTTAYAFTQPISKRINEIRKKVPRWSHKLITDSEQYERAQQKDVVTDYQIRTRKSKRVVIYTTKQDNNDPNTDISHPADEVALTRYAQQSDFRRYIIKGSMRAQRRKILILELFQAKVHSPLFLNRTKEASFYSVYVVTLIRRFQRYMRKKPEIQLSQQEKLKEQEVKKEELAEKKLEEFVLKQREEKAKLEEDKRIKVAETWDTIPFAQILRGLMLMTQSIFRKYILIPLLIIAKNIVRLLLFQRAEWSEDFDDWSKERHIKCTYNGVQLSETEFPKNWLTDGIQIKIVFPFYLKPWHTSRDLLKKQKQNQTDDYCFLTVLGTETDILFGPPRKHPSFFNRIFKQLGKNIRKFPNARKIWIMKILLFFKKIKIMLKGNRILGFGLSEESREIKQEKDSIITNHMIHESSIQTRFLNRTNSSVPEKKIKDLANRTRT
ncbi:unnamed protein product, partial [Amaranthus hypochondriacus]